MTNLSIKSANLIGHSMGGRTAMVLALTQPLKVEKLVVVDISPISTPGFLTNYLPQIIEMMKTLNFTGLDPSAARALAKKRMKESGLIREEALISFLATNVGKKCDGTIGWQCNVDTLHRCIGDICSFPTFAGTKYEGPALFIGGDMSDFIPPGDIEGIRGLFPKANVTYINGVGHNVHAEDPATFVQVVTEFVK